MDNGLWLGQIYIYIVGFSVPISLAAAYVDLDSAGTHTIPQMWRSSRQGMHISRGDYMILDDIFLVRVIDDVRSLHGLRSR